MSWWNVFKKPAPRAPAATPAVPTVAPRAGEPMPAVPVLPTGGHPRATAAGAAPVILRRVVTEKTTRQVAAGQYTFLIDGAANKVMVHRAVSERFGVTPSKITIINMSSGRRRYGRVWGRRQGYKKAMVCLPPGAKIETEKPTT